MELGLGSTCTRPQSILHYSPPSELISQCFLLELQESLLKLIICEHIIIIMITKIKFLMVLQLISVHYKISEFIFYQRANHAWVGESLICTRNSKYSDSLYAIKKPSRKYLHSMLETLEINEKFVCCAAIHWIRHCVTSKLIVKEA